MQHLVADLQVYSAWRVRLSDSIAAHRDWLRTQELDDAHIKVRIQRLLDRLSDDKLNVAFVAEFSRGKTELINAIFFADYGQRLLPSRAGRTTMCPTEILFDETRAPVIELLPIETRANSTSTTEYKRKPEAWHRVPLDVNSPESILQAFHEVSLTRRVTLQEASGYGLYHEGNKDDALLVDAAATIEIPCWRHAIINFPHPLLKEGLVILDTPGLNAIGSEPELTLNLLPNAHAVLFILAADTGVTKTDSDIWRQHIANLQGRKKGRMVVLNKIDGLWDELKTPAEIEQEIVKQVKSTAALLNVSVSQVFPVSAQKAMVAKVRKDASLLAKSRLPLLEKALSDYLIPAKQEIVRETIYGEVDDLLNNTRSLLDSRRSATRRQLEELSALRGKNKDLIAHMMQKAQKEKDSFDQGLQRFQAVRSIFSQQTNTLHGYLGMDALKAEVERTRAAMHKSRFSKGIREAMTQFFSAVSQNLWKATRQVGEILEMMDAMYSKFSQEHGIPHVSPMSFSTAKYLREIERLQNSYNKHFNTTRTMLINRKSTLVHKFFETLASRVLYTFEIANRDVENWLIAVMTPMETRMREHQLQLRRRLDSIQHIHAATGSLEERITELQHNAIDLGRQLSEVGFQRVKLSAALEIGDKRQKAA
ncbi:MAG: dynamin family protein [Burkholderiales bacterium]|nr:dynamin family protein [Burkholderiales bacterium]MDQ3195772.1 dynamin family protein [Pseudomonadota bacterium]